MSGISAETPLRHPALELLARYRAVLGTAWAARHDLAGPRRLAHEAAFLPAALALQETPPHPAPRRTMWLIMGLFVLALAWSLWGRVDIVAVAPGRLVAGVGRQPVQPLQTAVVARVLVHEGDLVRAGQPLLELDPTAPAADHASLQAQAAAAQAEAARTAAVLAALDGGPPPRADAGAQAEWRDLQARRARLRAEADRLRAEAATAQAALEKLQALLPLARRREADLTALAAQGFMADHAVQDRTRERIEAEREEATQQARVAAAHAALAEAREAALALEAEARRTLHERLARARDEQARLLPQQHKGAHLEGLSTLRAPADGRVQELVVRGPGAVVTPAQTLMVLVPAQGGLLLEAMLDNKDIGFVHEGQAVRVKLEAFPFTRHGTLPGRVASVSADAVADDRGQARFLVRVHLETDTLRVDGKPIRLGAGLNATAEIRTGQRRVIGFLLDPVRRTVDESGGER